MDPWKPGKERGQNRMDKRWAWALAAAVAVAGAAAGPRSARAETLAPVRHGYFTEYELPRPLRQPLGIAVDARRRIWVTLDATDAVGVLQPATGEFRELRPPVPLTLYVARTGPDGALWFTDYYLDPRPGRGHIVRLDPGTERFSLFPVPTPGAGPGGFRVAADHTVWVAEFQGARLARLRPTGQVEELPLVPPGERTPGPFGVELDAAGRVWVAESYQKRLARLDPASGRVDRFPLPAGVWSPTDLMRDARGRLWVSGHGSGRLAYLDPETGQAAEFPTVPPDPAVAATTTPVGLALGRDGHIWFAEHEGNRIGRVIPEAGTVVEYPLPRPRTEAQWLAVDPDGHVWYAGYSANVVGRLDGGAPYALLAVPVRQVRLPQGERYQGSLTVRAAGGRVALDLAGLILEEGGTEAGGKTAAGLQVTFSPARVELGPGEERTVAFTLAASPEAAAGERLVLLAGRSPELLASTPVRLEVVPPAPLSLAWLRARIGWAAAAGALVALLALARRFRGRRHDLEQGRR